MPLHALSGFQGPLKYKTPFLSLCLQFPIVVSICHSFPLTHTQTCTLACLQQLQKLRERGDIKAFFTIMKFSEDKRIGNFLHANKFFLKSKFGSLTK